MAFIQEADVRSLDREIAPACPACARAPLATFPASCRYAVPWHCGRPLRCAGPVRSEDSGEFYDYVRPLATIEPTAIKFGLPVDASIGVSHTDQLEVALEKRRYHNAVVIVASEHNDIVTIARDLLSANGGDATRVPEEWPGHDFDSLFVITITRDGKSTNASFEQKHEGLDGQPIDCR
jgi:hypothetical protein